MIFQVIRLYKSDDIPPLQRRGKRLFATLAPRKSEESQDHDAEQQNLTPTMSIVLLPHGHHEIRTLT
jgi:hypothetical protein